jgi:hypothetical protein
MPKDISVLIIEMSEPRFRKSSPLVFYAIPNIPHERADTLSLVLQPYWSPHNHSIFASGGEGGKVMIWKVEGSEFEGCGSEHCDWDCTSMCC